VGDNGLSAFPDAVAVDGILPDGRDEVCMLLKDSVDKTKKPERCQYTKFTFVERGACRNFSGLAFVCARANSGKRHHSDDDA
jgi:hypothetical protein